VEAHSRLEPQALVPGPVALAVQVEIEHLGVEAVEEVVDQRRHQAGLRAEVAVHQARHDARGLGHVGDLEVAPRSDGPLARGVEQAPARGLPLDRGRRGGG
jgi:hypothetical protein